ncbi:MAG: hypothetical protein IKA10_04535 [Oscillospiraceae bacterium]|nr:hypothetical protein [Oscillospiraceae bacterium]
MKSKENTPKTLHLVLKRKWYDKIESGEKTSEYREIKPYWNKRFWGLETANKKIVCRPYDTVVFHKGYTSTTMKFRIIEIQTTSQPNDLGLDRCWEIKLGQRIA